MLAVALDRDVSGDLLLSDMGQGLPFRPGTFDGAISISAIQWLCQSETSEETDLPARRLGRFFDGLYASLRRGARAVCQFYPKNAVQREMICAAAVRAGFGAGVLEDDPGTKNAKLYLVLTVGGTMGIGEEGVQGRTADITGVVDGLEGVEVHDSRRRREGGDGRRKRGEEVKGSRGWIVRKKERMERQGKVVKPNSKYTGRKRRVQF